MTCHCRDCEHTKLNPEPTVSQWAALARARRTGKVGNPKWYRSPTVRPFVFVPHQPPKYPRLPSGAEMTARQVIRRPDPFLAASKHSTTAAYVRAYEKAVGLRCAALAKARG